MKEEFFGLLKDLSLLLIEILKFIVLVYFIIILTKSIAVDIQQLF